MPPCHRRVERLGRPAHRAADPGALSDAPAPATVARAGWSRVARRVARQLEMAQSAVGLDPHEPSPSLVRLATHIREDRGRRAQDEVSPGTNDGHGFTAIETRDVTPRYWPRHASIFTAPQHALRSSDG